MSAAAQEEMFVAFAPPPMVGSDEEIFSLAAALALLETDNSKNTVKGEKPHQGVSSRKAALFLGPELCNSTTALGVSWCWWTGTALGAGDSYDYDAFGNLINQTGSTPNNYLFAGEQYDSAIGLYCNRARYLNTATGRFWSMDTYAGNPRDPLSLHKYLYTAANPVNHTDRSGRDFDLGTTIGTLAVQAQLYVLSVPAQIGAAFAAGGTAVGVLWNSLGAEAENFAAQVLDEAEIELPEIETLSQQPVGQRVIDFIVKNTETAKQLFIEVKYGIPYNADAMSRLVAQLQAAAQAAQQTGGGVVLWTLNTPTAAQLQALESELPNVDIEVVSGVENLYMFVTNYFK